MLQAILVALVLSLGMVALLAFRLKAKDFGGFHWASFAIAAAVFWSIFAAMLISYAWGFYYSHFAPGWYRYAAPAGALVLYPGLAMIIRWLSLRLPGNPVIAFCLLGGLESVPEHLIGIYRFGILEIPVLRGTAPGAILLFAYFEYVVYWAVVLLLTDLVHRLARRLKRSRDAHP